MITIGIELNHVLRDINKQIIKYYSKEFDPSIDIDEIDATSDVLKDVCKFESKHARNSFLYIDYPYEIFGCANTAEKKLSTKITSWLSEIENIEDDDIRIVFYSLNEEALTIQSTYFFLSKIGTRVRKVFFPKDISEIWSECDIAVTANKDVVDYARDNDKKVVLVRRKINDGCECKLSYDNLSDIIDDKEFFEKIK